MRTCTFLALIFLGQCCLAQVDTTRDQEIRFSILGQSEVKSMFPLDWFGMNSTDPTITYLHRIKDSERFFKVQVTGLPGFQNTPFLQDSIIGDSKFRHLDLYLGIEQQQQFRHFGVFISAGIFGMTSRLSGDFKLDDEREFRDYSSRLFFTGLEGQVSFYSNISDNIYVYFTVASKLFFTNGEQNQNLIANFENNKWVADFNTSLFDAVGFAYKF